MLAFGIVMALYLLTYAIANGVQDLDGFFEEWGFEGWQEAYDGIEIIDFRGPDKPKPERGPLELKPYELDQDVKPYHDRFPSRWPFVFDSPEYGPIPIDVDAIDGTRG